MLFLFIFVSNSLRVPYLCKHPTGKSKDAASPNLSVQSCHASLFRERRGLSTLPLRHRRRDFPPRAVFTQTRDLPDVFSAANLTDRTMRPTQTFIPSTCLTVDKRVANLVEFARTLYLTAFFLHCLTQQGAKIVQHHFQRFSFAVRSDKSTTGQSQTNVTHVFRCARFGLL